jgi:purine-binding chemotaxis protein CheW
MSDRAPGGIPALVVRVHTRACALPLAHVIETMRPLPIETIAGVPSFVRGVCIIRGAPTPVVDLGVLLGAPGGDGNRFVTVRLGDKQVALCVDAVLGIHHLDEATMQGLPPVLTDASNDVIEALGTLDDRILVVLRATWELPDDVWHALEAREISA